LRVGAEQVLTEPASFAALELGREAPEQLRATLELRATSTGALHGLGGWFSAELAQGVDLTNSPLSDGQIDRECLFLPFAEPVQVAEGEVLCVTLTVHDKNRFYAWHVQRKGKQGEVETVCKQTSLGSLLLSKKELQQTAPDYRPALNQRGVATRTVLDLCDEKRPLSEVIGLTQERHAKLLPTRERAAEFVQRTLGRLVR
jgi:hypothetical protein